MRAPVRNLERRCKDTALVPLAYCARLRMRAQWPPLFTKETPHEDPPRRRRPHLSRCW